MQENFGKFDGLFAVWNATQPFYLTEASLAFGDVYIAKSMLKCIEDCKSENNKVIIFIFISLLNFIIILFMNFYITNNKENSY